MGLKGTPAKRMSGQQFGVCQHKYFPVYSARRSDQWERVSTSLFAKTNVFSKAATPPKAQHPQPLRLKNYWRRQIWRALDHPTTEGAHNASCNLSGTKDRWGAARFRAAPFLFLENDMALKQTPLNAAHRAM